MLPYLFFNPPAVQFSVIIKPLFESFKGVVSTSSLEELHRTALSWLDEHCSLPVLRPSEWGRGAVGLWGLADPFMLSSRGGPLAAFSAAENPRSAADTRQTARAEG